MKHSRILITGVGGFVGGHLARRLVQDGVRAWGLGVVEPASEVRALLGGYFLADLRNADALNAAVVNVEPDAVIHLAGQSSTARSLQAPEETFRTNAVGTWNVLEAVSAGAPDARVLVVGTGEAYGPQPKGTRVTEDAPFQPLSPYALSKAAADALAEAYGRTRELDVVRTRSFGHTGPGQPPHFVIPSWARQVAEIEAGSAEPILKVGNLDVTRDLLDVRDVVEAYLAMLERARSGQAYNVCRGEGIVLRQVVEDLVAKARRKVSVEVDPDRVRKVDNPYLVGDPERLHADTGWQAAIPFTQTLEDVLEEWRGRTTPGGGG